MEVLLQGTNLSAHQVAFHEAISFAPVTAECIFKEFKLYFTTVDYTQKMKVFESPVESLYLAAMLPSNMRNCIYCNQVASYFNCTPPILEDDLVHKD